MVKLKRQPSVGIYSEMGRWIDTAIFRHKWQAYLFHWLLNSSTTHNGTREY